MAQQLIGDATPAQIRLAIVEAMIKLAGHGSVPAATAALRLVDDMEAAQVRDEVICKMTIGDQCERVRYLAALGLSPGECYRISKCDASEKTRAAFVKGQDERLLCARVAEQRQAHKTGKVPAWMSDRYDVRGK